MATVGRRRLIPAAAAALAGLVLALVLVVPSSSASPQPSTAHQASAPSRTIAIDSITPLLKDSDDAVITGRVINTGEGDLAPSRVDLVVAPVATDRAGIASWSASRSLIAGQALASTRTDEGLSPGASAPFTLTVRSDRIGRSDWGVTPVSIQSGDAAVHTYLAHSGTAGYQPVRLLWGIPITLPADHELWATGPGRRLTAWEALLEPRSRLFNLAATPPEKGAFWLLDPTLAEGGVDPDRSDLPVEATPEQVDGRRSQRDEYALRDDFAQRLASDLVPERTIALPAADADISVADRPGTSDLLASQVEAARPTAEELGIRSDLAWPADGLMSNERVPALDRVYGAAPRATIVPTTTFGSPVLTGSAARLTPTGLRLLLADAQLSGAVGGLTEDNAVLVRQRVAAETAAYVRYAPDEARTLLVLPDRYSTPDPGEYRDLRDATDDLPWVTTTDIADELKRTTSAAELALPNTTKEAQTLAKESGARLRPAAFSTRSAEQITTNLRSLASFASVRADGDGWRQATEPSLTQLTSSRWRADPDEARAQLHWTDRVTTLPSDALEVNSGQVNFFADTGRLQITVINRTGASLESLRVRLTPGSPILQISDQPEPFAIAPNARHTVTVSAEALAAGNVPVKIQVLDPEGEPLATPATLQVLVSPTGDWVYWALGALAVMFFAAGTWRSVRRRRQPAEPRVAPEEAR